MKQIFNLNIYLGKNIKILENEILILEFVSWLSRISIPRLIISSRNINSGYAYYILLIDVFFFC